MAVTEVRIADDQMKVIERMGRGGNSAPASSTSSGGGGFSLPSIPGLNSSFDVMGKAVDTASRTINEWREANRQYGISMSNDAIGFGASVMKSRMSLNEFMDSVDFSRSGFARIGGTMSESAKVFLKISTDMADSGMADQLKQMGFTTGEYNKLLALTLSSSRNLNLQRAEDQAKATQSVMEMATEMDKVSKLTGASRKEQEDILEKQRKDQKFQSELRLLEAKGVDTTRLREQQKLAELSGFGDVFKQLVTGGARTEDVNQLIAVMGPDAQKMIQNIKDLKSVDAETRDAAAKRAEIDTRAASVRLLTDEKINTMTKLYNTQFADTTRAAQQKAQDYNEGILQIMKDQNVNENEAARIAAEMATREQKKEAPGTGEKVTGAATTEAIISGEARVNDLRKKQGELIEAGNASISRQIENMKILEQLQAKNAKGEVWADNLGGIGPAIDSLTSQLKSGTTIANIDDIAKKFLEAGAVTFGNVTATVKDLIVNATGVKIDTKSLGVPGEAAGSKAVWGDWFSGPSGLANIRESGPEAVVPYNLVPEFINDMQSKFSSIMQPTDAKPISMPEIQLPQMTSTSGDSELLKDINDQLSKLNNSMSQLVRTNVEILDNSSKQYRATRQLSPNLNAR